MNTLLPRARVKNPCIKPADKHPDSSTLDNIKLRARVSYFIHKINS